MKYYFILFYLQSTLFMIAGYDTTGHTMTNTIFMLTIYPEIQEKLYNAIIEKLEKYVWIRIFI